jgi:hypothetical protein
VADQRRRIRRREKKETNKGWNNREYPEFANFDLKETKFENN